MKPFHWTTVVLLKNWFLLINLVYHVTTQTAGVTPPTTKKVPQLDRFSTEKQLAQQLLAIYKDIGSHGRPVKNYSDPLTVEVALHLVQILDIDEHNQVLTTSMRTMFKWHDDFLIWNPDDYSGLKVVGMSPREVWVPDIILSNSVAEEESLSSARFPLAQVAEEEEIDKFAIVKVHHNGSLHWSQRKVYRTSCTIDMANYPFDTQECSMIVKSSSYDQHELDITSMYEEDTNLLDVEDHHILKEYIVSPEWDVIEVRMYEDLKDTTLSDTMRYIIKLRRRLVFFTYILLLPCLFLTIMTMVIFWLPPERPDKTTLAMSIFSSFTILLLVLVGSIPSTASSVPLLGVYYFFNMVISAMSIILATTVVNISRSGRNKPKVPKWLKSIAIDTLGGMFGVTGGGRVSKVAERLKEKAEIKRREKMLKKNADRTTSVTVYKPGEGSSVSMARQKVAEAHGIDTSDTEQVSVKPGSEANTMTKKFSRENMGPLGSYKQRSYPGQLSSRGSDSSYQDFDALEEGRDTNSPGRRSGEDTKITLEDSECLETLNRMERFVMEIRSYIKQMADFSDRKEKRMDIRDEKAQEWHAVAVALDRLFFFIYLAMLFILAIVSSAILFPRTF